MDQSQVFLKGSISIEMSTKMHGVLEALTQLLQLRLCLWQAAVHISHDRIVICGLVAFIAAVVLGYGYDDQYLFIIAFN